MHRFPLACSVLLLLAAVSTALCHAEEPVWLNLLDRQSLAGWDHAPQRPAGWNVSDGRLSGSGQATPLLSGWTWGDFDLEFRWTLEEGGVWQLGLPSVPQGTGLAVMLGEGTGGLRVERDGRPVAQADIATPPQEGHVIRLRRRGDRLSILVDGRETARVPASDSRCGLSLKLAAGRGTLWDLRGAEPAGEPIFNGRDLAGWWTPGNRDSWIVENQAIVCINQGGNYLRTEKLFGNFTASLEYKIRKRGNSGVGIRTAPAGWPSSDGMELQIEEGRGLGASATMALYRNVPPIALAEKSGEWNHAVIKADGRMISAWLNGVLVQHVNTARTPELRHRPLEGWIGFQDHGARVEFRNLRVLEAPPGLGLAAWYSPRPEPAASVVLDRLMNPATLSLPSGQGIESHAVAASLEKGEQVVADLKGPGALVRLATDLKADEAHAVQLEFYFDGHTEPRIKCRASELHQHVPPVTEERLPVTTFLPFARGLKVVARGKPGSGLRLDYLTLPPSLPVETFRGREETLPRGLLAALDYRHFQISHGTYRDHDPLPRQSSGSKSISPGERVPLVSLEGAGIVQWLRLEAEPKVLENDDLWLEVTVDGEAVPALAAPVRYLFPGLHGGRNYANFLLLHRAGLQHVLPMPFGQGLSIAAMNRGTQTVTAGLTVSFQPDGQPAAAAPLQPDGQPAAAAVVGGGPAAAARWRLRGVFQPAGVSASREICRLAGPGRWIGLVCQSPTKGGISRLIVDGQPREGWTSSDLDLLLGLALGEEKSACLSGRQAGLAWRWLLLDPIEFQQSLVLEGTEEGGLGGRLILYCAGPAPR